MWGIPEIIKALQLFTVWFIVGDSVELDDADMVVCEDAVCIYEDELCIKVSPTFYFCTNLLEMTRYSILENPNGFIKQLDYSEFRCSKKQNLVSCEMGIQEFNCKWSCNLKKNICKGECQ